MVASALQFTTTRAVVIGDVMLDQYWYGTATRISPEAPVPIVKIDHAESRAGGAANVAVNIAKLGGQVALLGIIGEDAQGQELKQSLQHPNISSDLIAIPGLKTITKLRIMSHYQQMIRLDFEDAFDSGHQALHCHLTQRLAQTNVVVFSDYAKGTLNQVTQLIQQCLPFRIPLIVDPKSSDFTRYRGATVITPNLVEFEAAAGCCASYAMMMTRARELCQDCDIQALLITLGRDGMILVEKDAQSIHIPTDQVDVLDVTGAGDTVVATLACALVSGKNLAEAAYLANKAGSLVVKKQGCSSVTPQELEAIIPTHCD